MKPTQRAELFLNIKDTIVSFFSILMFVALAVGVFLGISWAGPALENGMDSKLVDGSFHSFQVQFPYGLTDEDMATLSDLDYVSDVEPTYVTFEKLLLDSKKLTVRVQTLTQRMDTVTVQEGKLPTSPDQIALLTSAADRYGIKVGDTVTFASKGAKPTDDADSAEAIDADSMLYLTGTQYKVTALVMSPEYLATDSASFGYAPSGSGVIDLIAWVPMEAYARSEYYDAYPVVNIRCADLDGLNTFSKEYEERSGQIESELVELGDELGTARYDSLVNKADTKIGDAEKDLEEGKAKVAKGEQDLQKAQEELKSQKEKGRKELEDAHQKLLDGEKEIEAAKREIEKARTTVAKGREAIDAVDQARAEYESHVNEYLDLAEAAVARYESSNQTPEEKIALDTELDALANNAMETLQPYASQFGMNVPNINADNIIDALNNAGDLTDNIDSVPVTYEGTTLSLGEARSAVEQAERDLSDAEAQLAQKEAELEAGWEAYDAGKEKLAKSVAEGEQKIADGEKDLEAAKQQVAEAEPQIEEARKRLEALQAYSWSILSRAMNGGVVAVSTYSDMTTNMSLSISLLFVIVGALVSYSAVTRIAYAQTSQIGTKKALGLSQKEVTESYLWYAGISVLIGVAIGTVVGVLLVEGMVSFALQGMFVIGHYPAYVGVPLLCVALVVELALVLGATWLACRDILRKSAVDLLRGEEPPTAKGRFYEKWGIWNKLSPFSKVVVNNCFNDTRRVFSTIVGVTGCTALIITAIMLNNNVKKNINTQYADVYGFNVVTYVDEKAEGAADKAEAVLMQDGFATAQVVRRLVSLSLPTGECAPLRMFVPKDVTSFQSLYHVLPAEGGTVDLSRDGVWLSEAYGYHFNVHPGDTIRIDAGDGKEHQLPILGFYKYYLTHNELVMGRDYYEREFDTSFVADVVLAQTNDADFAKVEQDLMASEGVDMVVNDEESEVTLFAEFSSVSSAVVLVYLLLSAIMAVVVLLNLNVSCIEEKKRELIVLMICGFSVKHAKRYIYDDIIVLTIIGIVLGVLLGNATGALSISSIEGADTLLIKSADGPAMLIGVIGSAVLSAIMCIWAMRRINRFDLTDINRF